MLAIIVLAKSSSNITDASLHPLLLSRPGPVMLGRRCCIFLPPAQVDWRCAGGIWSDSMLALYGPPAQLGSTP